jgi:hypothetical protein
MAPPFTRPVVLLGLMALVGCQEGQIATTADLALAAVTIEAVKPEVLLPGSSLTVQGRNFVEPERAVTTVELVGGVTKSDGSNTELSDRLPGSFQAETRVTVPVNEDFVALLGSGSRFRGTARVVVQPLGDGREYASAEKEVAVQLVDKLTPSWGAAPPTPSQLCLNGMVPIDGGGFLLGGGEGATKVRLQGCFRPRGSTVCAHVNVETVATPATEFDRSRAYFRYPTSIGGAQAGRFEGTMRLRNVHASGEITESSPAPLNVDILPPSIRSVTATSASLGGYVYFDGCGFIGGEAGEATLLRISGGTFTPDDGSAPQSIALTLVPEPVSGERVRYVISESDALGQILRPRQRSGRLQLRVAPVVQKNGTQLAGADTPVEFRLQPVRQVVVVEYLSTFRDVLAKYGLVELEDQVKGCVRNVIKQTYAGVNVDVRGVDPTDYALYARVVIADTDPNQGANRCGLDVSGTSASDRDRGNLRLDDVVGGFNATGGRNAHFGGVFPNCYFDLFSLHGVSDAVLTRLNATVKAEGQAFDQIFDALRPDLGGRAATAAERLALASLPEEDGTSCPSAGGDRLKAVSCAAYTLCRLVGETSAHEFGHTMGLANPTINTDSAHNCVDGEHRLMDDGSNRSFFERVPLRGDPKRSLVCQDENDYLRGLLPTGQADPYAGARPPCDGNRCRPSTMGAPIAAP